MKYRKSGISKPATDDLFDKFAAKDGDGVAALCASDFLAKQNNGPESDVETLLAGLHEMLWAQGVETAYSEVRRMVADQPWQNSMS